MTQKIYSQVDLNKYHQSVTEALFSLKNRIRNLVNHWPTDGEYKELALRNLLQKHLPSTVLIGRGFIVSPNKSSSQIDILIIDSRKPILFREGDLFIVTPDAVRGIIEVKTALRAKNEMLKTLKKLSDNEKMCFEITNSNIVWTGLFIYNGNKNNQLKILEAIGETFTNNKRPVNCISCGKDIFIRHWNEGANVNSPVSGPVWHSYEISGVAPSYFMGNFIDSITSIDTPSTSFAWFPMVGGKEKNRKFYLQQGFTDAKECQIKAPV